MATRDNGFYLALVPLSVGLTMGLGTVTTYIITTATKHADPLMPSISETGVQSPEKFVFSQMANMAAGLSLLTFALRFQMLQPLCDCPPHPSPLYTLTWINLFLGAFASLGLSIVGNCQVDTARIAHLTGAVVMFVLGTVYCYIDSYLTFKISPRFTPIVFGWLRLGLAVIATAALGLTLSGAFTEKDYLAWDKYPKYSRSHWRPDDPGYIMHTSSALAEWLLALCFLGQFLSLVPEFYRAHCRVVLTVSPLEGEDVKISDKTESKTVGEKSATEKTRLMTS